MNDQANIKNNNRIIVVLAGIAFGMFAFGFAMVPLYKLFCQVAGIQTVGSNTAVTQSATEQTQAESRLVTVKFDTTISSGLPWEFKSMTRKVRVKTGEANDVIFVARNLANESITGQAIPSVIPWQATDYFNKTECFCFQQQVLEPQQTKEMLLRFIVSTNLPEEIDSLTLSYTIMNTDTESAKKFSSDIKTENMNKYVTGTHMLNSSMLYKTDNQSF
ncbi:MAG: cytochrome c oxidase assembly protein [Proteobacteria bacterium]|nr:cytochrome c oxidase assembly protein [Pseudomonadota bacterium]